VSRSRGGGPVSNGGRSRENGVEKRCANARACAREAKRRARGPEKDVAMSKQELAQAARVVIAAELGHDSSSWRTQGRTAQGREGGSTIGE
jgi:hypothetical protein